MKDLPPSFWKRPLTGKRKWLSFYVLIVLLLVCPAYLMVLGDGTRLNNALLKSLFIALVGGFAGLGLIAFVRWVACWRNFRRFLLGVVCFITLIFLAYAFENWRGKRAWEAHKRQWEARGESFSISQLSPPPVPEEQNLAFTPLLKPLFEYSREPSAGLVQRDTNALARLNQIGIDLPDKSKTNGTALGNLEKGTFADLEETRKFYRGHTNYPQPTVSGTAAEDILVALGKFDPEMSELQQCSATRPYSRFPLEYEYEPAWVILLPHLAPIKRFSQIAHLRAVAQLEMGQSDKAMEELKLGLRLSGAIRNEPLLICHLVRIACLHYSLQTVREGLIRHAWTDEQLAEIEKLLANINLLSEYQLAMRGEHTFSTQGLDWMRRQGFQMETGLFDTGGGEDNGWWNGLSLMPSGWFYQNMVSMSEMFQKFTFPMVDEKAHRVSAELMEKSDAALERVKAHPGVYRIFVGMFMPALGNACLKSAKMQIYVDATRVACAVERHRLATGKLPESLDAIVPAYIASIPVDVFDGKPLRYSVKADGAYVIYSVGQNQTDEGGELVWRKDQAQAVDFLRGDWVWQMPVKPITNAELPRNMRLQGKSESR